MIIFPQLLCFPNAAGNTPLPWFCFELELEVSCFDMPTARSKGLHGNRYFLTAKKLASSKIGTIE